MTKRRRPWGLMGLVGLGGLLLASSAKADGGEDDELDGGDDDDDRCDEDGGCSTDEDDPAEDDADDDDPFGDLPPPPVPDPKPEWDRPHIGRRGDDGDGPDPSPSPEPDPSPEPEPDPEPDPEWRRPHIGRHDDDGNRVPPSPAPRPIPINPLPLDPNPLHDGPPWSELIDPYPRGASFYQVVRDDRFGGTSSTHSIAYRYLLSEAYLAAREYGELEDEDAKAWAVAVAKNDKRRLQVIDMIQCGGWDDAMYGAEPVRQAHASAHGRAILLRPVHGPTAALLADERTPFRNITMAGNPADGAYRHYELLWLAAIDREALWASGGTVITTTGMVWADGTSMENPPPWVMALGMNDESGALSGDFGCPGSDGELEVG